MREDWETHDRRLSHPGLQIVLLQRFGAWRLGLRPGLPRKSASFVYRTLNWLLQNVYGAAVYDTTRLGRRVRISHPTGILIGGDVAVGDGCLIRHNVTIGFGQWGDDVAPRLGRDVELGVGSVVIRRSHDWRRRTHRPECRRSHRRRRRGDGVCTPRTSHSPTRD